jgi:hypothetical protein
MKQKAWLLILLWSVYIAILTLFGDYIISKEMNPWIQYICSVCILIMSYYIFKFTFKPLISKTKK